jgi:ankyrin repeat protein
MLMLSNAVATEVLGILLESDTLQSANATSMRDMFGRTPLHYAAKFDNYLACTMLLDTMPELLEVRDDSGWSALDLALFLARDQAAAVLEDAGSTLFLGQFVLLCESV